MLILASVNRQLIYNWPEQLFSEAGIASIEHADFDGTLVYGVRTEYLVQYILTPSRC
jgi:hypothetical protein